MTPPRRTLLALLLAGCASSAAPPAPPPTCPDEPDTVDLDGDAIAPRHERPEGFWIDFDSDGLPNDEDPDSDGDGLPDAVEAGDALCATVPVDTDADGAPDFLDRDSNGDGFDDVDRRDEDTDGDGILDYLDPDVDGDGIPNRVEMGADALPIDTDGDGVPDHLDLDTDNDGVPDAEDLADDLDGDGIPGFRDLDSDGDGLADLGEAGDDDPGTPPVSCARELDPAWHPERDPGPPRFVDDGVPDFRDVDSDGDGLTDGEEYALGTNRCGWDTDDDGLRDAVEAALALLYCPPVPDGPFDPRYCGSPLDPSWPPGPEVVAAAVVPWGGGPVDVGFGLRVPDEGDLPLDGVRLRVELLDDGAGTSADGLVLSAAPACRHRAGVDPLPDDPCWTLPPDADPEAGAPEATEDGFSNVVPGTTLDFVLTVDDLVPPRAITTFRVGRILVVVGEGAARDAGALVVIVPPTS